MSKPILSALSRNHLLVPLKRSFSAIVWSRHMVHWPSTTSTWSVSLSFASPESDFTARSNIQVHLQENDNEWSQDLGFASPESDFSSRYTTQVHCQEEEVQGLPPTHLWSNRLSFTSPESDFSSQWKTERRSIYPTNSDLPLFINHPETALGSILVSESLDQQLLQDLQQDKQQEGEPLSASLEAEEDFSAQWKTERHSIYPINDDLPLSSNHPETALGSILVSEILDEQLLQDLQQDKQQEGEPLSASLEAEEDFSAHWRTEHHSIYPINDDLPLSINHPETALGSILFSESLDQQLLQDPQHDKLQETEPLSASLEAEEDFSAQWQTERHSIYPTNDDLPLFIDHPETALGSILLSEILDQQLLRDLQQDKKQQQEEEPLPASLEEIYANPQDPRAIVITSAQEPFSIVDVNDAWVGLCGYSREESRNHSLAKLLQGPETNQDKLREFMRLLREGQQASTVITNYTKEGRKFRNRVRAAPLSERGEIAHFVGVLQEIA